MPEIKRICIRATNWLGDCCISYPALIAVRKKYPDAHISLLVRDLWAELFKNTGVVDEVIPFTPKGGIFGHISTTVSVVKKLKKLNADIAIIFPNSFESALWMFLAGIKTRIGFNRASRGCLLTNSISATESIVEGHQRDYYLEIVSHIDAVDIKNDEFCLPFDAITQAKEILKSFNINPSKTIALAIGAAAGPAKEWHFESYAALSDLLHKDGWQIVLIGSPSEVKRAEKVASACSEAKPIVLAGKISVVESAGILSLCEGFVGNDSGSMHLAGILNTPTVGLFGSSRPDRTSPLGKFTATIRNAVECSPCLAKRCKFNSADEKFMCCWSAISVDEVQKTLLGVMEKKKCASSI